MNNCLTPLAVMKSSLRFHLTVVRMAVIKKATKTVRERNPYTLLAAENIKFVQPLWKVSRFLRSKNYHMI